MSIDPVARALFGQSIIAATPYIKANTAKWMFSSNGWRAPTQHYVPGASALFGVSEKWFVSDDYWTFNPRFLFANWYLTTSGGGGQEAANGNAITIQAVSIIVGGVTTQLNINGSSGSYTLADDTEIWTDAPALLALPPRSRFAIRVAWSVPNSASNISTPYPGLRPHWGDKSEVSASDLSAKVMAGGISTAIPAGNSVYCLTPIAMVAQGWTEDRPVVLGFGTSIEQGVGQSRYHAGPYGEIGPIGRGLVSTKNGAQRLPGVIWAISGGLAAGISGIGANQGLTRRMRALAALPNIPMTTLYSGFGTNDATATLSAWQSAMTGLWTALKAAWPTLPLLQSSIWHRVASTDGFITVGNQSAQSANWTLNTGSAWGLHRWMMGLTTQYFDVFLDVHDAIDNFSGGGTKGTWRVDVLDASWTTTLSANVSAAGTSATMAAMPRAGAILAFSDNAEAIIALTTSGTAAPFTANFASGLANGHTSGATIKEALSVEGTHPGDLMAAKVGDDFYGQAKIQGRFLQGF